MYKVWRSGNYIKVVTLDGTRYKGPCKKVEIYANADDSKFTIANLTLEGNNPFYSVQKLADIPLSVLYKENEVAYTLEEFEEFINSNTANFSTASGGSGAYTLSEQAIGTIEVSVGVFKTLYQQSIILTQPSVGSVDSYDTAISATKVISVESFTDSGVWSFGSCVIDSSGSGSIAPSFQAEASSGNIMIHWQGAPDVGSDMYITLRYTKD